MRTVCKVQCNHFCILVNMRDATFQHSFQTLSHIRRNTTNVNEFICFFHSSCSSKLFRVTTNTVHRSGCSYKAPQCCQSQINRLLKIETLEGNLHFKGKRNVVLTFTYCISNTQNIPWKHTSSKFIACYARGETGKQSYSHRCRTPY